MKTETVRAPKPPSGGLQQGAGGGGRPPKQPSAGSTPAGAEGTRLYVGNLAWETGDAELSGAAAAWGSL